MSWKKMLMRRAQVLGVAAFLLLASVTAACSSSSISGDSDEMLPAASATDWVTYADYLVQLSVDDEHRVAGTDEEQKAGEGVIGRRVTVTVENVFWTRPGFTQPAPRLMTWDAGGWAFHGQEEKPLQSEGVAHLIPGHRYLVPIVRVAVSADDKSTSVWLPLGGTAMLPFDDGVVGNGERISASVGSYEGHSFGTTPMRDSVWGKHAKDVVDVLNSARPDPAAADYMSLDPRLRYSKVMSAGHPPAEPGPGEIP